MAILLAACGGGKKAPLQTEMVAVVPQFDADSAYSYVERQVAFGPRVPNSAAHRACGDYLISYLRACGADIAQQAVELTAYNGDRLQARNIIAQFQVFYKCFCEIFNGKSLYCPDPEQSRGVRHHLGDDESLAVLHILLCPQVTQRAFFGKFQYVAPGVYSYAKNPQGKRTFSQRLRKHLKRCAFSRIFLNLRFFKNLQEICRHFPK